MTNGLTYHKRRLTQLRAQHELLKQSMNRLHSLLPKSVDGVPLLPNVLFYSEERQRWCKIELVPVVLDELDNEPVFQTGDLYFDRQALAVTHGE